MSTDLSKDEDEDECGRISNDDESSFEPEQADFEQEAEDNLKGNKLMVSKMENGKLSYIHISQAIKIYYQESISQDADRNDTGPQNFYLVKNPLIPSKIYSYLEMWL